MKFKKHLLVASFGVLAMASCASGPKADAPYKPNLPEMTATAKAEYAKELAIVSGDDIRGNIYMPTELKDGATVTWHSNNKNVITDKEEDGMAPGVVTRYTTDKEVKLTATVVKDGEYCMVEQDVTVRKDYGVPEDEDYVGYLLVTFTGEGSANGEQVYMSLAGEGEGFKFQGLKNNQPILTSVASEKGVRDPFIYRSPEGDKFYIIATDLKINNRKNQDGSNGGWSNTSHGYTFPTVNGTHTLILWETTDLANWGEPTYIPVADGITAEAAGIENPEDYPHGGAGMAWAPEMTYNYETGEYVIFWSSAYIDDLTKKDNDKIKVKGDAIYRTTTRDFKHFSTPTLFIDNLPNKDGSLRNIIDATCMKIGDYYYSITKDGDNPDREGGILIQRSQNILDVNAWEKVCDLDELGLPAVTNGVAYNNTTLEGPALFQFNKCDWKDEDVPEYCVMADDYNNRMGGGYIPFATTNIEDATNADNSWRVLPKSDYSWGNGGKRHGSVLKLTAEDLDTIKSSSLYGF